MISDLQKVNSKILLFGEYTILSHAPALAIPFEGYKGYLDFFSVDISQTSIDSNLIINKFFDFIADTPLSKYFHLDNFKKDLEKGLYFNSDIPKGYGLGSSGALCAAIAKEYGAHQIDKFTYPELRKFFSEMESFFHGKSSGIDPLVIYLNSPLFLEKGDVKIVDINKANLKSDNLSVFLLDTASTGDTAPLVDWFSEQLQTEEYKIELYNKYVPLLSEVIKSFLEYDNLSFKLCIKEMSKLQTKLFSRMIPKEILTIWEEGNTSNNFHLKLCGSGGGGYMLGFTYLNKEELSYILRNKNVDLTYIV